MFRSERIGNGCVYSLDRSVDLRKFKAEARGLGFHPFEAAISRIIGQGTVLADLTILEGSVDTYEVHIHADGTEGPGVGCDLRAHACTLVFREDFMNDLQERMTIMDSPIVQYMPIIPFSLSEAADALVFWADRNGFTPAHKHLRFVVRVQDVPPSTSP